MSSDKKNSKPVPYKPNLPELSSPATEEPAGLTSRLNIKDQEKAEEFENIVEAPKRLQ